MSVKRSETVKIQKNTEHTDTKNPSIGNDLDAYYGKKYISIQSM